MGKKRIFTPAELAAITNINLSTEELGKILGVRSCQASCIRRKLGIQVPKRKSGPKTGKPCPARERKEVRHCINPACTKTFIVIPSRTKKYCSHSCHTKCNNPGVKGVGNGKIRNPQITEFKRYSRKVHKLSHETYLKNIDIINPNRYKRTLAGVADGWQLDHIIPIKECFKKGIPAEDAAKLENLRMLPWRENLMRQFKERQ